ncbi:MAG: DUF932 domain-containing protein [Blastomonas fulva]
MSTAIHSTVLNEKAGRQRPGHVLEPHQSLEAWAQKASMNWTIKEAPVRFKAEEGGAAESLHLYESQKVLYRSDSKQPLSVVSSRYQVVQPLEVLEFYRDLTEISGYELETAGVLKGGRKFWALARTGREAVLKGSDLVRGYLLLATSCDGSIATIATPTTIRVACENSLTAALGTAQGAVKVSHSTAFDADAVKRELGVAVAGWDEFMFRMRTLADRKVKASEASGFFLKVLCNAEREAAGDQKLFNERALKKVQGLYDGQGRGADLSSAKNTAWGLLNAVTEFVDHERRARNDDYRLDSAWFGQGAALKDRALKIALELAS